VTEPIWVAKFALLQLHAESLAEHGGSEGLRDEGLLDSALARPRNQFLYGAATAIPELASVYAAAICQNHSFVDGNKRAALLAAGVFLSINGFRLTATQVSATKAILDLAAGTLSNEDLCVWFQENSIPSALST
jgi:death-on-curing protein